jgi:hypothetical protein
MTAGIAQLKIKLDDVEPAVVRRVEVPLAIRLDRLHLVLQAGDRLDQQPSLRVPRPRHWLGRA